MATSPKTTSKPRPKRSRMDAAQNSVLVKLMERVDQLSAIVSHQVHAGKPADDGPQQDQKFAAVAVPLRPTVLQLARFQIRYCGFVMLWIDFVNT